MTEKLLTGTLNVNANKQTNVCLGLSNGLYILPHLDYISLGIDYPVERCGITVFAFGSIYVTKFIGSPKRLN